MAVVLSDPGIDRSGEQGAQFMAQNLLQMGQQAQQNRMAVGEKFFEQFKKEAEIKGLSMSQLLEDPAYQQSVFGNLVGMTGDRKQAEQMFNMLKAGEATPTQVMNKKFYDHMAQFKNLPLYDQQVDQEVSREVQKTVKGEAKQVTPALIASLKDKINENNIWTPIAKELGAEPESYTEDGIPIWGEQFRALRDEISKGYTGKTWDEVKGDKGLRDQLLQGMQTGAPLSVFAQKTFAVDETAIGQKYGIPQLGITAKPGEDEALAKRASDYSAFGSLQRLYKPDTPVESGDKAQLFVNPIVATDKPVVFGEYTPEQLQTYTKPEVVKKTIPGYASTFENASAMLRKQAPIEAQRSVVGDIAIRDAEATIQLKQAQTLQSIASLQGKGKDDPRIKPMLDQYMKTYDQFMNETPEDLAKRLNDAEKIADHNKQVGSFIQSMKALGIYVEPVAIPKERLIRADLPAIQTVGGMRLMGSDAGSTMDLNAMFAALQ